MRRLFVVFALLAMMISLRALQTETTPGTDPLTLAAIGFVVLAAFAIAELGARRLPKVSGYILSGVLMGPFAIAVLSKGMVGELKMFGNLALGLIATTAGLELDLRALARLTRTLGATIGIKLVTGVLLVGGSLLAYELATGILGLGDTQSVIALSLVFAALSLGTSPAIVLAVESESNAKGRLSEIVLGAAVVKDVIVVICLAIAMAIARAMLGGGDLGVEVLFHVGDELGRSILAGLLLGGLLIAYLRWVKTEMLLFVVAMVLVVAEISAAMHLELLLVFIVAGVVVRNLSHYEHDLLHPLQMVSLPVFIVFFTSAGASIDLEATWTLLPLALVLCTARALGYIVAGRLGGRAGGESEPVQRLAWLGYLPQAGVTLGLVGLAEKSLPELGGPIATLGMAVVAVNLAVGPITLRIALRAAGETDEGEAEDEAEATAETEVIEALPDELEATLLRQELGRLRDALAEPWAQWRREVLAPATEQWLSGLQGRTEGRSSDHGAALVVRGLERVEIVDEHDRADSLRAVLAEQLSRLQALDSTVVVPLEDRNARAQEHDGWWVRWRKRTATVGAVLSGRRGRRRRQVPLRIAARTVIEPAMARLAEESLRDWQRYEVECLETLERVASRTLDWADAGQELQRRHALVLEKVERNHEASLWAATRALGRQLAVLGAPGAPHSVRYSRVERDLQASLARLHEDADAWPAHRRAALDRLRFTAETELVEHRVCARLQQEVVTPLDAAFERLDGLVTEQRRRLETLPRAADLTDEDAWSRAQAQVRAVLPKPAHKELRGLTTRVRRATSSDATGTELRSFVSDGAEEITVVGSLARIAQAPRPSTVQIVTVNARELKEVQLAGRVLPLIEQCLGDTAAAFGAVRDQMREVVNLVEFGMEVATRDRDKEGGVQQLDEAIDRGLAMLDALQQADTGTHAWTDVRERLLGAVTGLAEQLSDLVAATAGEGVGPSTAPMSRLERWRVRARLWRRRSFSALRRMLHALQTGEVGQAAEDLALRYRLRAGLERFDAHAIRSFLAEQRELRRDRLGGLHGSLFTTDPLRDPRLFVANREALGTIVRAERAWQSDSGSGNGVLVVGASGVGKSSTVGIAQLKLGTRRVISVRDAEGDDGTLRSALAQALGIADEDGISSALGHTASIVVIDDVHRFFPPTEVGLRALEDFVELVVRSQAYTFWLISIAEESMQAWQRLVALDDAFPCRVHLQAPDIKVLDAVIEARRDLGGQRCAYPVPRGAWLSKLLRRSPQEAYMRRLGAVAGGSLRRAMMLWRAHAEVDSDTLRLRTIVALSWRLPFLQQLRPEVRAVLTLLVRHGAQRRPAIAEALGLSEDEVQVHMRFLVASGLVLDLQGSYDAEPLIKDDLVAALRETGAVGGGE